MYEIKSKYFSMKYIVILLLLSLSYVQQVTAYTPSEDLRTKIDLAIEKIEDLIDSNGEEYRNIFLVRIEEYMDKYEDEKTVYILHMCMIL